MADHYSRDRLAYWYFRLNGFLMLENFVIHDDVRKDQRTEADLFGVRFANRSENDVRPMVDDSTITVDTHFCNVVIVEATEGRCKLNGPWTRPADENMQRALRALGCFEQHETDKRASELYECGDTQSGNVRCRLIAIGDSTVPELQGKAVQITWQQVARFIRKRLRDYSRQKSSVGNWTEDGIWLKQNCRFADFAERALTKFKLPDDKR